ncbi:FliM/FliN family flagellar motor switch protein [Oceanicola sp. 22II-s10i]|uniref:FliM/FliN family flagellar motor switch protein n=1 Tax=Oceanicola sp. 22II-s10i TaxID=1317116 RepID=UPI000B524A16|nr:FliM/FliN family flagellar motor switch protein [Oceanicola sp. 22II-s10i]
MDGNTSSAVLRRKADAGREVRQARAMSPDRALRLAFARAADEAARLALAVSGVETSEVSADDLVAGLDDDDMLLLLEGPGGAVGVMSLSLPVVAGVAEMLTMGRVLKRPVDPRRPTRTEAALLAPLIDRALENLAGALAGTADEARFTGYRFGVMMDNARMVGLALDASKVLRIRMSFDVAGLREGAVSLCLPEPVVAADTGTGDGGDGAGTLGAAVLGAPARLDAVLHRVRMPYARVAALRPGDVIPVPRSALSETVLETPQRQKVMTVRLGQINGFRAVRLPGGAVTAEATADGDLADAGAPPPVATAQGRAPPAPPPAMADPAGLPESEAVAPLDDLPDLSDLGLPDGLGEGFGGGYGIAPLAEPDDPE